MAEKKLAANANQAKMLRTFEEAPTISLRVCRELQSFTSKRLLPTLLAVLEQPLKLAEKRQPFQDPARCFGFG